MKKLALVIATALMVCVVAAAIAREWRPVASTAPGAPGVLQTRRLKGAPANGIKLGIPPGMTLSSDGELHGIPTEAGTFLFQLQVTDANGATSTRWFTIPITDNLIAQRPKEMGGNK